jgi:hypothetical protein
LAHAPLNLTPEWQAWHLAGLASLLLDEAAASLVRQSEAAAGARTPPAAGRAGQAEPAIEQAAERMVERARPARPVAEPMAQALNPADGPATDPVDGSADDPDAWPDLWRGLLTRMQPAPLAWTYPELGDDLLLGGNQERSAALREMISRLRLPRGSSTFWPARLPDSLLPPAAGQPAPDYFRAGLKRLGVRFLIVFGPGTLAGTAYEALPLKPFSEQLSDGRLILTLPDFSSLLAVPDRLDKVVFFLHSVLSRYLCG